MMNSNLSEHYGPTMEPQSKSACQLMEQFSRWVVAELHELGCETRGFGRVDPQWLLYRMEYGKEWLRKTLTEMQLAMMIARTFFYGRPKTIADAYLCQLIAKSAFEYGIMQTLPQHAATRNPATV